MRRIVVTVVMTVGFALGANAVAQAAPPGGVTAASLSGRIEVAWQPVQGATGYRVLRGTSEDNVADVGVSIPPTATTFADTRINAGTQYFYAVRTAGEAGASRVASASGSRADVLERRDGAGRELPARRAAVDR